ncbi:hypothetical protein [Serratia silvae]|uniref:Uncharacterized protein n=1 Tax=Serratia silvae TaxID=2824122 RepID=A0ABT0KA40_9GAMM|nr:hypothetical protein [Serratia silvae]MCL1028870.1 hypothetical protein [Serratia silvae]
MLKLNKSPWSFCLYILLCMSLCVLGYLWFSYSSRKMNISSEFRILYYVIMLTINLLFVKIFFNLLVRNRSYITTFIFGALIGTICGFIAWEASVLSMEHSREILINTLKRETLVSYLIVTVPLSAALTLSFLIGAVISAISKYFWCKPKNPGKTAGGLQ